jgi:hypothetical protein
MLVTSVGADTGNMSFRGQQITAAFRMFSMNKGFSECATEIGNMTIPYRRGKV